MATLTVNRSDRYPIGSSVGAYPRGCRKFAGAPSGTAVETQAVDATGKLTFTTLVEGVSYVLYAGVVDEGVTKHRYIEVEVSSQPEPLTLHGRIEQRQALAGV